jgi:predicted nucleic acid-binding protein
MSVFVDTSGLLAVLDATDENHEKADETWLALLHGEEVLTTSNYVFVETFALAKSRLGFKAARTLGQDIAPVFSIHWVEREEHEAAVAAVLASGRRRLSLVDCVSFEVMRRQGIRRSFAFDGHFEEQGFDSIP